MCFYKLNDQLKSNCDLRKKNDGTFLNKLKKIKKKKLPIEA